VLESLHLLKEVRLMEQKLVDQRLEPSVATDVFVLLTPRREELESLHSLVVE
jgi:hypothetical protein